jgi:serine/threonine-protein kinase
MSPEQARGATDVDHRADLYAMGVLLFECLAGRPPFDSPTDLAIIHAHANTEPPDITALDPSLPPGLGQMLLRSLAKSPDERFQSADQFCAAFEASLSAMPPVEPGKPMAPLPPTPSVPRASLMAIPPEAFEEAAEAQREAEAGAPADGEAAPAEDAAPEAAAAPVPAPKKRRRWLWPAVALGALLLAGAGAGLAFLKFGGHEPEAEAAKPLVVPTRPTTPEPPRPEVPAPGPVAPKKPVKLYGTLKVATVLSGRPYPAAVEVDGVDRGETPVTLELVTGKHRVRVLRAGFQTTDKEVVISHRQTSTVKVDLIP